ncbi:hypothetical protein D3C71_1868630 [compost metagenome]
MGRAACHGIETVFILGIQETIPELRRLHHKVDRQGLVCAILAQAGRGGARSQVAADEFIGNPVFGRPRHMAAQSQREQTGDDVFAHTTL